MNVTLCVYVNVCCCCWIEEFFKQSVRFSPCYDNLHSCEYAFHVQFLSKYLFVADILLATIFISDFSLCIDFIITVTEDGANVSFHSNLFTAAILYHFYRYRNKCLLLILSLWCMNLVLFIFIYLFIYFVNIFSVIVDILQF